MFVNLQACSALRCANAPYAITDMGIAGESSAYYELWDWPLYITQVKIPIFMQNRQILIYVTKGITSGVLN